MVGHGDGFLEKCGCCGVATLHRGGGRWSFCIFVVVLGCVAFTGLGHGRREKTSRRSLDYSLLNQPLDNSKDDIHIIGMFLPLFITNVLQFKLNWIFIFLMQNQSTRNLQHENKEMPHKIKFSRSNSRIKVDQLNQIQNHNWFLSRILCLHHLKTAFRYMCDINNENIVKYNSDYEEFIVNTKLRDVALQKNEKGEAINVLLEALRLEKWAIFLVIFMSLLVGAASVVVIYYQQTLAKYIITQTSSEQYKWFGIIVGCIVFRFLAFNYLMALTNNIAINIKVGMENLFMRAIFFLDYNQEELNMHRMRFLAIESFIEGIIFIPYALISLSIIIGVCVLIFILNNRYGFVFFGIFIFFLVIHTLILVFVYYRLKRNEEIKDEVAQESKWVFRSLLPLIFDRISEKIVNNMLKAKNKSLHSDKFYNFCYSFSQFLADAVVVVSFIVYYGLNNDKIKEMTLTNTYLTAAYLGMLYFPFKIYVYGSFTLVRGFEQYFSMVQNFRLHFNDKKLKDIHLFSTHPLKNHSYPDNLGQCFHYEYDIADQSTHTEAEMNLPSNTQLKRSQSNAFYELQPAEGETIMAYFNTNNKNQVERYIKELLNGLPIEKTVAIINENNFVLPESFQENIIFYSEYKEERFHQILRLVELDYFIPQIEALGNTHLNYRISKYYPWHECRLELARALYNSVDYLFINKYIMIEDQKLLKSVINFRKRQGKITFIANNWHFDMFRLADKVAFFENDKRQIGYYMDIIAKRDSILNEIKSKLRRDGIYTQKSEEVAHFHQSFVALVTKKQKPIQLQRKIYFEFFDFAHPGGFLVVLIALAAPIGFKVYVNYLIGQSIKKAIYPDILIFGVIYLVLIFLRGLVLALYFRFSSFQLFSKIISKHRELCGDQILSIYKEKDDRIENDFKKIDSNLVINFELGFSVLFDTLGGLIIVAIGQPIVLAMALPLMVLTTIVNILYNKVERGLLLLRNRYQEQLKIFINHCTTRALALFRYGQYQHIQQRFNEMHRIHIMFSCNEMWILSGMRMIGEITIIIGVIIFLIIMIETQYRQTSNLAMISYGVSLFINMNFSYRFNLKTFSIIEAQMLALTKCVDFFKVVEEEAQETQKKIESNLMNIDQVDTIEYRNINIQLGSNQCSDVNLKIHRGDRISVSSDSRSLVTLPFYLLRRNVFSRDHVKGDILINGQPSDNFVIDGLFFIHFKPLLPYSGTIFDVCLQWKEDITQQDCTNLLNTFFDEIGIDHIFSIDAPLNSLSIGYQQILSVFRALKFQNPKVLVMISSFDYMDIFTRIKIEKYLINYKPISILINITNNPEITHLYKRNIIFKDHHFVNDISSKDEHDKRKNSMERIKAQ